MAEKYPTVQIYLIWFAHSLLYGHLAVVENAVPDTGVCGFMCICTSDSLLSLGVELLIFRGTSKCIVTSLAPSLSTHMLASACVANVKGISLCY